VPKIIKISEFEIEVTKKKMKTMRLRVLSDGKICISAPKGISEKAIKDFAESHSEWIRDAVSKVKQDEAAGNGGCRAGEHLYLFGEKYLIEENTGRKKSLVLREEKAILTIPENTDDDARKKFITEWYREKLKEEIPPLLEKWESISGLTCSSWQIRDMKSRWGSCSINSKSIRLNLQLAKRPKICLEYVILHELAHTKVAGHGADFKAILDRFMPEWRKIKKLLNTPHN
jgi:predicted metal-dependent hydrolase